MNAYQVIWLTRQWKRLRLLHAANPSAVDQAVSAIEQALGMDPHGSGTPLSEGLFKFDSPPLRVFYSIQSPRLRVIIHHVDEIP